MNKRLQGGDGRASARPGVRTIGNKHPLARLDLLEQFQQVRVTHADAAMRERLAHRRRVRAAMDVNESAQGIVLAAPVISRFQAGQPENPGQYPVPLWVASRQFRIVNFASRAATDEDRVERQSGPDLEADAMPAARRAPAAALLAGAVAGGRHRVGDNDPALFQQLQSLIRKADENQ